MDLDLLIFAKSLNGKKRVSMYFFDILVIIRIRG